MFVINRVGQGIQVPLVLHNFIMKVMWEVRPDHDLLWTFPITVSRSSKKKKTTVNWHSSEVKITFIPYMKYFVFTVFFLEYPFETWLTEKCNSVQVIHVYLLKHLLTLYKTKGQNHIRLHLFNLVKMYNIQCDSFALLMTTESSYHIHHI